MRTQIENMQSASFPQALLIGGLGAFGGAFCFADWLSSPMIAQQLWPADVHQTILTWLGGTVNRAVGGGIVVEVSTLSLLLRLVVLLLLSVGIGGFVRCSSRRELLLSVLLKLGAGGIAVVIVWGLHLFVFESMVRGMLLPPLIMMLAGWWLYSLTSPFVCELPDRERTSSRWPLTVLLVAMTGWIAASFWLNQRLYVNLLIPHGDSAMYEEHLWNVWHGKGFRSYLDQGLFLGEHIQVIHLLLLPLHMIWPSHLLLELAESVALGSCAVPLFLMVHRRTGDPWAACLVAISWLLFFPMHFLDIAVDQKSFRPVSLGLPFVLWMIHCAETQRFRVAWLMLLLALSAKEDMALMVAPVAIMLGWQARRDGNPSVMRWGWAAGLLSAIWLVLAVLVVIPAFRSGDVVHYSRYFGDLGSSPGELIKTALTSPGRVLSQLVSLRTLFYVTVFLAPVSFIAVRRPLTLLGGVLTFSMLALIQLGGGAESGELPPIPYHHFHGPLLPVVFWAVAAGVAACDQRWSGLAGEVIPHSPRMAASLVLCCCLSTGLAGSLLPAGAGFWSATSPFGRHALYFPRGEVAAEQKMIERSEMAERVVTRIPMTARVASTDFIHTRLTHWERSYDYSGYRRVVNEEGHRVPADCEYIVIDTGHRYSEIRSADEIPELTESNDWELLPDETNGIFLILRRRQTE